MDGRPYNVALKLKIACGGSCHWWHKMCIE